MGRSHGRRGGVAGEEAVLALVGRHAGELLRFARRFSVCADDAQDAYQRALEKLVRRMRSEPPQDVLPWLRTVLRHEAMQVRAERERAIGQMLPLDEERDGDDVLADPAERVERFERLAHTAEALRGLKPQELTALVLRAEGLSYREICERTHWSYTRLNRCLAEGRRSLAQRLQAIESGAECRRWLPLLSRFADGEASAREVALLRPHLRTCAGCRATVRGFHAAPGRVGALVPVGLAPGLLAGVGVAEPDGVVRSLSLLHGLLDRASTSMTATAIRAQSVIDTLPGAKLAAVAASTVAVAGGGAAIEQAATAGARRVPAEQLATAPQGDADGAGSSAGAQGTIPIGASLLAPAGGRSSQGAGASSGTAAGAAADSAAGGIAAGEFDLGAGAVADGSAVAIRSPAEWTTAAGDAAARPARASSTTSGAGSGTTSGDDGTALDAGAATAADAVGAAHDGDVASADGAATAGKPDRAGRRSSAAAGAPADTTAPSTEATSRTPTSPRRGDPVFTPAPSQSAPPSDRSSAGEFGGF